MIGSVTPGTLAIIGGGRMGEAICAGLLDAGAVRAPDVVVAEPDADRRDALARAWGVRCVDDGRDAVQGASLVILAVKPQVIDEIVAHLAPCVPEDSVVVSIAAGVTTSRLEAALAPGARVVRVMPNTPSMVRAGMSVVSGGSSASAEQCEEVRALFEAVGHALVIPEADQNAATAISGSGPAYFALFVDALAAAGEREGLERAVALELAVRTMRGTAELLASGVSPGELIAGVSSPGGTTVAALGSMRGDDMEGAIGRAVRSAVARAEELGAE